MELCTTGLTNCQPVFKESMPGARLLTNKGEVLLQAKPVQCGYTPTAGNNCGGFRRQPKGAAVDRAMAFVGQQGMTQQAVLAAQEALTYTCSPGMSGCSVAFISHPSDVQTTVEGLSEPRDGEASSLMGTGQELIEDDSVAYGEYDRIVSSSDAALMDEYNSKVLAQCRSSMCDYNKTVETNSCTRITSGTVLLGTMLSGFGSLLAGATTDGLLLVPVWRVGMATTGTVSAGVGSACGYVVATRHSSCYAWCESTFGPGAWYPGATAEPTQ